MVINARESVRIAKLRVMHHVLKSVKRFWCVVIIAKNLALITVHHVNNNAKLNVFILNVC